MRGGLQSDDPVEGGRGNLRYALQLLACGPEDQIAHYLPHDFAFKADEVALEFSHWAEWATHQLALTPAQREALLGLDAYLASFSGAANSTLWTDHALRDDPHWEEVRRLARTALAVFEWPEDVPPPEQFIHQGSD